MKKGRIIIGLIVLIIIAFIFFWPSGIKVGGFVGKSTDFNPVTNEDCLQYEVHVVITNYGFKMLKYDNIYAGWQSLYGNVPTHTVNTKEGYWELDFMESDTLHLSSNGWTDTLFYYYHDEHRTVIGDSTVYFYLSLENKGKFVSELYVAQLPTFGKLSFCSPFFPQSAKDYQPVKFNKQPIGSALKF